MQESSPNSEVSLTLAVDNKDMVFDIEDSGEGVPWGMGKLIFEPWVKLSNSSVPGVGLGLAICRSVLQEINGSISCGARKDGKKGALFSIRVPYFPAEVGPSLQKKPEVKPKAKPASGLALTWKLSNRSLMTFLRQIVKSAASQFLAAVRTIRLMIFSEIIIRHHSLKHGYGVDSCGTQLLGLVGILWGILLSLSTPLAGCAAVFCGLFLFCKSSGAHTGILNTSLVCAIVTLTAIIISVDLGSCFTPQRSCISIVPVISSFFYPDFRLTTLWLVVSCAIMFFLNTETACKERPLERNYIFHCGTDVLFGLISFVICYAYDAHRKYADQARKNFLSSISKELRTPLQDIADASEAIIERCNLTESNLENIQIIFGCSQQLLVLVDNLLYIGEELYLRSARSTILSTYHPKDLCLRMRRLVKFGPDCRKSRLDVEVSPLLGYCRGDMTRLPQIFLNLLNAAMKVRKHGVVWCIVGLVW